MFNRSSQSFEDGSVSRVTDWNNFVIADEFSKPSPFVRLSADREGPSGGRQGWGTHGKRHRPSRPHAVGQGGRPGGSRPPPLSCGGRRPAVSRLLGAAPCAAVPGPWMAGRHVGRHFAEGRHVGRAQHCRARFLRRLLTSRPCSKSRVIRCWGHVCRN